MLVTMSQKELNRIPVLQQVCDKLLTQSAAAKLLNLNVRQLQRVLVRYLSDGATGIASRKRGKPASAIVDNKRLGAVLKLAQVQQDELDRDGQSMPKRRAQARIQEQLRAINPVLANP
ncbi:helix-turn-helix domain-containing protein [Serratia proteamaculans]|uniref:Helix-turn-helix domain-containing protein n=1 Tax=Serratia proteamaculans TaxID=28151 RepID=A0ABS0TYP6_SERPR|nr:helix-turn-helix domain-containing protein [Serratia proteamaculans]